MRCEVCGAELTATKTDLPFKVRETGIVILKSLPVLQCANCPQYLIEDAVHVEPLAGRGAGEVAEGLDAPGADPHVRPVRARAGSVHHLPANQDTVEVHASPLPPASALPGPPRGKCPAARRARSRGSPLVPETGLGYAVRGRVGAAGDDGETCRDASSWTGLA